VETTFRTNITTETSI